MSSQDNNEHYNDDADVHVPICVATYRDGQVGIVQEVCSCKMHQPDLVKHMAAMPANMYATFLAIPLQRH